MALRKSDLYSTLWQSCDALRGGMTYFRSNGGAEMRRNLVWFGYIKGIFMIDARAGCMASSSLCAVRGKREADSPAG
jgi:hypothetical protein